MTSRLLPKILLIVVLSLVLQSCSINITQVAPSAQPVTATSTSAPSAESSAATQAPIATVAPTSTSVPWADLKVSGSLVYTQGKQGVLKLDLVTGQTIELLAPDDRMWLQALAVSPDSTTIVITYSPPPPADQVQLGYTDLYQIPGDGTTPPQPILERSDPQESYFSPDWTPDGKYLYYADFVPIRESGGNTFKYTIERIAYPDGEAEVIVEDAIWPKLSPDGTKLAYLKFDTVTYIQELYLADLDGQNATPVLSPDTFPSVDAQFFSPDGKTLVFNAVGQGQSPALALIDWLMGVQVVEAHNVPSDWWSIQMDTDPEPVRLTELYDVGMYGDFSPDGKHIAFISASGLYIMDPAGEEVRPLGLVDTLGTLEWVP